MAIPSLDTVATGRPSTRLGISFFPACVATDGLLATWTGGESGSGEAW
ncbi:MAG: hypothetical protein OXI46_06670 [Gemmatimonadota bacterium]|nr:hypothetical protein [Gemmatimonadota bacterium]